MNLRPIWSRPTDARLQGLSLAREAGSLLAWDEGNALYLWDFTGRELARYRLLRPVVAAAISDDGSQVIAASKDGGLWWLDGRLTLQFDQALHVQPLAIALEPLGRYLAVSDRQRRTHLLTRYGKPVTSFDTPQPLRFLQFVPSATVLLGTADYGFVGCFDLNGECLWRDMLVSYIGSLTSDGQGNAVLLACFSNGLRRYRLAGGHGEDIRTPQPCRLACVDFEGSRVMIATEGNSLALLNLTGQVMGEVDIERAASALVMGALGDFAAFGVAEGKVSGVEIPPVS